MNLSNKPKGLSNQGMGIMLIVPGLLLYLSIIVYPFINSVVMSFTNRSMLVQKYSFVGIRNYAGVLTDSAFISTLSTTAMFVLLSTLLPFVLGLIWAILLNQGFKGSELLRGVTLVNWIIPSVCIGFLWSWIFNGQYGILNAILTRTGLISTAISWLGQKNTALLCVVIAKTWQMLPWYMAFLLGGLQSVSMDQIEAAWIDGAGNWQVFKKVIIPAMSKIITIVLLLGVIGNLQHFDLPFTMTNGGPGRATTTLALEVYRNAFQNWKLGKAATVGTIWAVFLSIFCFIYLRKANED